MGKRKKKRQASPPPRRNHDRLQRARLWLVALLTFTAVVATASVFYIVQSDDANDEKSTQGSKRTSAPLTASIASQPESLKELLSLSDEELAKVDLAVMNLLCAEGLPGSEKIDIADHSRTLEQWAEYVCLETERHLYKFRQAPQDYENSEGFFRMLMLNTVLQQDFGVHYNLERMREIDFKNSRDLFLHGMINDNNGGTCASMPVLITAIAVRLGYPVRLVATKAHVFCRWDEPGDRINLEVSTIGLNTYPDSHYKKWPIPSSEAEIKSQNFLVSRSPKENLAMFLSNRGHCLVDNQRFTEAEAVFVKVMTLCPDVGRYKSFLADARNKHNMMVIGSSQRDGIGQINRDANPEARWNTREHTRRWNERYSTQAPTPKSNRYVQTQSGAINPFESTSAGISQQQPVRQNIP